MARTIKTGMLPMRLPDSRKEAHLSVLIVLGMILFVFEAYIPRPIPWLKLGLANLATLIALYWYGAGAAILVSLYRIILGSLFIGTFLTPGFFLSLSGGLCAVLGMILLYHFRIFGIWAVSVAGAGLHGAGQLLAGYFLFFRNAVILNLFPFMLLYGLLSGSIIAYLSYLLLKQLKKEFALTGT